MKINKGNFGWIFACVLLVIALVISILLGVNGWYFKNQQSYKIDMELGKVLSVELDKNSANSISVNLDGSYLPEERLPQVASIKNISDNDIFLRAKVFVYSSDFSNLEMGLVETVNWRYNQEDGYYYFDGTLPSQNKVSLCSHVYIQDENLASNTRYIVTFLAEGLSADEDAQRIWSVDFEKLFASEE